MQRPHRRAAPKRALLLALSLSLTGLSGCSTEALMTFQALAPLLESMLSMAAQSSSYSGAPAAMPPMPQTDSSLPPLPGGYDYWNMDAYGSPLAGFGEDGLPGRDS